SFPRRWCGRSRGSAATYRASSRPWWPRRCRPNGGASPADFVVSHLQNGSTTMKPRKTPALAARPGLPLPACHCEEAVVDGKAPGPAPTTDDKAAWQAYLNAQIPRHMEGITNQPYVYRVPATDNPDDPEEYNRLLDKAKLDVARGIVKGNILAYAGLDPTKTADLVVAAFEQVPPDTMKGVRVVYIGDAANNGRVKAAVEPAGVDYVFVEAK